MSNRYSLPDTAPHTIDHQSAMPLPASSPHPPLPIPVAEDSGIQSIHNNVSENRGRMIAGMLPPGFIVNRKALPDYFRH